MIYSLELGVGKQSSFELGVGMQRWGSTALNWVWLGFNNLELGVGIKRLGWTGHAITKGLGTMHVLKYSTDIKFKNGGVRS